MKKLNKKENDKLISNFYKNNQSAYSLENENGFKPRQIYILNNELYFQYSYDNYDVIIYINEQGLHHRISGPAVIFDDGASPFYWINGKPHSFSSFTKETNHLICNFCKKFCKQECF